MLPAPPNASSSDGPQWIAIVAASLTGVIGRDGDMPWKLSSDLRRFKAITTGYPILMGRKTYESIGRPLPGRRNLVLSSTMAPQEGIEVVPSMNALEAAVQDAARVFVIGGGQLYSSLLPRCDYLLLTRVWTQTTGDTTLDLDLTNYACELSSRLPQTQRDSAPTEFQVWKRPHTEPT